VRWLARAVIFFLHYVHVSISIYIKNSTVFVRIQASMCCIGLIKTLSRLMVPYGISFVLSLLAMPLGGRFYVS